MTRAKQHLYLCRAQVRRFYQDLQRTTPSRFLREIPQDILELSCA